MWVFKPAAVGTAWRTESSAGSQRARIATRGSPYLHPAPLAVPPSSADACRVGLVWLWGTSQGSPSPPPQKLPGVLLGFLPREPGVGSIPGDKVHKMWGPPRLQPQELPTLKLVHSQFIAICQYGSLSVPPSSRFLVSRAQLRLWIHVPFQILGGGGGEEKAFPNPLRVLEWV